MPSVALGVPFQEQEFVGFGINMGSSSIRHVVVIVIGPHLLWSFTFMGGGAKCESDQCDGMLQYDDG